jgi:hypothetical protein
MRIAAGPSGCAAMTSTVTDLLPVEAHGTAWDRGPARRLATRLRAAARLWVWRRAGPPSPRRSLTHRPFDSCGVQHPHPAAVRGGDDHAIAGMHDEVHDVDRRQIAAEHRPLLAAVG